VNGAGAPHGKGIAVDLDGSCFEGEWIDGKKEGKGTEASFGFGERYKGDFVGGKKEGKGKQTFWSGYTYQGDFVNDQPDGEGTLTDGKGVIVFKGRWIGGVLFCANLVSCRNPDTFFLSSFFTLLFVM
jgi:hypothetical protein